MKKGEKVGKVQFTVKQKKQKPFNEVTEEYIKICKRKNLSETTIKGYRYSCKYFMAFNENNYITKNSVNNYVDYLESKNTNIATINSYIRKLSPLFRYAYEMGYYPKVEVNFIKYQKQAKDIYTKEELNKLLQKPRKKTFVNIRNWAMAWTFASTGIRRNELQHLRICNIDLLNRTLLLNKTKNKNYRYIPISSSLYDVLLEYMELRQGEKEDYLFCTVYNTKMATSSINKEMELYNAMQGVVTTGIHRYRHTFITNAVNNNVNILLLKKITGHSSTTTLSGYYNAKVNDALEIIDTIAPKGLKQSRKSMFKK